MFGITTPIKKETQKTVFKMLLSLFLCKVCTRTGKETLSLKQPLTYINSTFCYFITLIKGHYNSIYVSDYDTCKN